MLHLFMFELTPKFCGELTGTASIGYEASPSFGFAYDSDNGFYGFSDNGSEESGWSVSVEGSLFVGLAMEADFEDVTEVLLSAGLEAKFGLEISGELALIFLATGR